MESILNVAFWQNVLEQTVTWIVRSVPKLVVVLALAFIVLKLASYALQRIRVALIERHGDEEESSVELEKRLTTLLGIVGYVVKIVVWGIVVMLALRELGVDIAPIIAGAGVVGLAVGFGAQNLVRDVISGFFLLIENQVRTGDVAVINGTGGLVEKISLRTITLRDLSGIVHIFPNGAISSLANMTKGWSAMVFDVGVAYRERTDRVVEVMKGVSEELRSDPEFEEKILEPMEIFGVDRFDDSAVIVKARIKTRPSQQWVVGREYNRRLKMKFDKEGIEIPFPHRSLYFGEASKPFSLLVERAAGGDANGSLAGADQPAADR